MLAIAAASLLCVRWGMFFSLEPEAMDNDLPSWEGSTDPALPVVDVMPTTTPDGAPGGKSPARWFIVAGVCIALIALVAGALAFAKGQSGSSTPDPLIRARAYCAALTAQ